eukprot:GHVP01040855.1.p1 GENE.GHVP01040855.1~~GHVP01040855.1.p1  ORF type:complete len:212 (-),score=15.07 GHVP01040855.1:185-820(-)
MRVLVSRGINPCELDSRSMPRFLAFSSGAYAAKMLGFSEAHLNWSYEFDERINLHQNLALLKEEFLVLASIKEDHFKEQTEPPPVGSVVLYKLSDYERANEYGHPASSSVKSSLQWSLPCRVQKSTPTILVVRPIGANSNEDRQVPVTQVRAFQTNLPNCLWKVAMDELRFETPRFSKISPEKWKAMSQLTALEEHDLPTPSTWQSGPKLS